MRETMRDTIKRLGFSPLPDRQRWMNEARWGLLPRIEDDMDDLRDDDSFDHDIYYDDDPIIDGITHEPPAEQTDAQNERIQNDDYSDLENVL